MALPGLTLAGAAIKAMFGLYDRHYGPTAEQIKALKKDIIEIDARLAKARATIVEFARENAAVRSKNSGLLADLKWYRERFESFMVEAVKPQPLDPNPYDDEETDKPAGDVLP